MGPSQALNGNRLLSALARDEYAVLQPLLEPIVLEPSTLLIKAHRPITHVHFPESGIVSVLAETSQGRIEIGMIGREGMVGLAVALGADQTPHSFMVQGSGRSLRIDIATLRALLDERPATLKPFAAYAQAFLVQVGQTAYANASFSLDARLSRWILMMQDRMGSDHLLLTHEFLSAMLGVRRPGVTSALHQLEGIGAIRSTRGRVDILDRDKLIGLADESYVVAEQEYERLMS